MDMYEFMNSKVLFKNEELKKKVKWVIVHVNYHPDKLNRMQAVVEFYVNGKQDALDSLPDGFFWMNIHLKSSVGSKVFTVSWHFVILILLFLNCFNV